LIIHTETPQASSAQNYNSGGSGGIVCTSEMAAANAKLPIQQAEGEHDDNVVPVKCKPCNRRGESS